ncbi:hypothetical protein NVIRENTERO_00842 [Sodalis praecaptivus]|nr:hypothetical protein NVIRENTERO_00842 [Sodalis praecaptivus]
MPALAGDPLLEAAVAGANPQEPIAYWNRVVRGDIAYLPPAPDAEGAADGKGQAIAQRGGVIQRQHKPGAIAAVVVGGAIIKPADQLAKTILAAGDNNLSLPAPGPDAALRWP